LNGLARDVRVQRLNRAAGLRKVSQRYGLRHRMRVAECRVL
jgi:hypothetical protein